MLTKTYFRTPKKLLNIVIKNAYVASFKLIYDFVCHKICLKVFAISLK